MSPRAESAVVLWRQEFVEVIEPADLPDIYTDGMSSIEILGDTARWTYFAYRIGKNGLIERVVVCKRVQPVSIIPTVMEQVASAMRSVPLHGVLPPTVGKFHS